jgi:hypothetical protein
MLVENEAILASEAIPARLGCRRLSSSMLLLLLLLLAAAVKSDSAATAAESRLRVDSVRIAR